MMSEIEAGDGWRLIDTEKDTPMKGDQAFCGPGRWMNRNYRNRPFNKSVVYRRRITAKPEAMPSLVDSVKRIRHFATGRCDMPLETRLQCIAKECEASLSKLDADWREAQEGAK
jgi:hypothetical protein